MERDHKGKEEKHYQKISKSCVNCVSCFARFDIFFVMTNKFYVCMLVFMYV